MNQCQRELDCSVSRIFRAACLLKNMIIFEETGLCIRNERRRGGSVTGGRRGSELTCTAQRDPAGGAGADPIGGRTPRHRGMDPKILMTSPLTSLVTCSLAAWQPELKNFRAKAQRSNPGADPPGTRGDLGDPEADPVNQGADLRDTGADSTTGSEWHFWGVSCHFRFGPKTRRHRVSGHSRSNLKWPDTRVWVARVSPFRSLARRGPWARPPIPNQ